MAEITMKDIRALARMTDRNDHSAAVARLAELTGRADLIARAAEIVRQHEAEGEMTWALTHDRRTVMHEALDVFRPTLDRATFQKLYQAF